MELRVTGLAPAVLCLLLAGAAHACLNDRDSDALALQAQKFPDTVRVITGRFDRYPPLFYRMRIEWAKAELAEKPDEWGLYDDIAVAYDRIKQDSDAIEWMEKKRQRLPAFDPYDKAIKEPWYRYYANDGTFWVHRWLHDGAKMERINELHRAQAEIAQAIAIKPNAHFGREKYQLQALKWIELEKNHRLKPGDVAMDRLSWYLEDKNKWEQDDGEDSTPNLDAAVQGLSGLVVLGAAWESPDVFEALAHSLNSSTGNGLSCLALLRTQELLDAGKHPICPKLDGFVDVELRQPKIVALTWGLDEADVQKMRDLYPKLRREAEE